MNTTPKISLFFFLKTLFMMLVIRMGVSYVRRMRKRIKTLEARIIRLKLSNTLINIISNQNPKS